MNKLSAFSITVLLTFTYITAAVGSVFIIPAALVDHIFIVWASIAGLLFGFGIGAFWLGIEFHKVQILKNATRIVDGTLRDKPAVKVTYQMPPYHKNYYNRDVDGEIYQ